MNPYDSPQYDSYQSPPGYQNPYGIDPRSSVNGPGLSLIIVSSLWLFFVVIAIGFNIYLFASGMIDEMPEPPGGTFTKETQVTVRLIWACLLLVVNVVILFGGVQMRKLENYGLAKWSAILAVIPCVGPCYLLGIPFGIWALVVLNKPEVKQAFR